MNSYPRYAQVGEKKYKINTNYTVAIECEKVSMSDVSEEERGLAIIYLLFGDEGLNNPQDWQELGKLAIKFLSCGKEVDDGEKEDIDMDYEQDWEYIKTSFLQDYQRKITQKTYIHWWEFYNLLCGLSDKCVLSRVRFVRNFDISQIKDSKERDKWIKQKEQVAIKKQIRPKTAREQELDKLFEKQILKGE